MPLSLDTLKAEMRKFMVKDDPSFEDFPTNEAESKTAWMKAYTNYVLEGATSTFNISPNAIALSAATSSAEAVLFAGSSIVIGGPIDFALENALIAFWTAATPLFLTIFPPPPSHITSSLLYTPASEASIPPEPTILSDMADAYAANLADNNQEAALGRIAEVLHNHTVGKVAVIFTTTAPVPVPVPTILT